MSPNLIRLQVLEEHSSEWVERREHDYADEDRWRTKLMQRQANMMRSLEEKVDRRFEELAELIRTAQQSVKAAWPSASSRTVLAGSILPSPAFDLGADTIAIVWAERRVPTQLATLRGQLDRPRRLNIAGQRHG